MAMNIVPEVWAQEIKEQLQKSLVAATIADQNVAGEINKKGDVLHIITAGDVAVSDYHESDNITYEDPTDTESQLVINIDKYFAFKVEDAARKQANSPWEGIYQTRGAYKLRDSIDALLMAEYASAGLDSYETGTTAWQVGASGSEIPNLFAAIDKQLNDADAPMEGRYIILPTIGIQACKLYASSRGTTFGDTVLQNGMVGKMLGFDVFVSRNCVSGGGVVHGLAGVKGNGIAYAQQIGPEDIEPIRMEGRFASGIRGRVLGGIKTYRPGIVVDVNLNTTLLA